MARPLRFCMITTFYPPYNFGGDGIFVESLAHELAERGHSVDVIHCIDAYRMLAGSYPEAGYRTHPRVKVHGLKSPFGFLSPLATHQTGRPLLKRRLIREVLGRGFDVIHYHNISLVGGPAVLAEGEAIKLYTAHEYWLVCPTHVLFKQQREACREPECFKCLLSYRRPPQLWRYTGTLDRALAHVDAFIAPDRFTAGKLREFGLSLPFRYIPHFVPRGFSAERANGAAASKRRGAKGKASFLFVGRLERLKGLQDVIPAFTSRPTARLRIAGTGSYEPELRRLAAGLTNVEFLGFQSGEALARLFREATAVIVPSINFEVAPPLVIIEAFAHETAAIVRDLGSMPEPIEDSGGGLVFDDEHGLLAAIDRLANDPALASDLGRRGYQALHEKWTVDRHMERYFGLIDEVATGRGAGR